MFTLGVDFGTNSVRALVVRCSDGAEYGSGVVNYPSGAQGVLLDAKDGLLARQRPADYLFGLEESIKGALAEAGRKPDFDRSRVIGIGVDSTGSSPLPVDDKNQPLASSAKWKDDLNAQCWLWKDHTSWREAAKITELSAKLRPQYIAKCGGVYSSEWFWSKLWRCLNIAPKTFKLRSPGSSSPAGFPPYSLASSTHGGSARRLRRWSQALYSNIGAFQTRNSWERSTQQPNFETASMKRHDATQPAGSFTQNGRQAELAQTLRSMENFMRDWLRRARGLSSQGDRHLDLRLRGRFGRQADYRHSGICSIEGAILPGFSASKMTSRPSAHIQMVGRGRFGRRAAC